MSKYKIILTGGGSAGHVMPNLALVAGLKAEAYDIKYIGSINGIEKNIIQNEGIEYFKISSGKFRRGKDIKNIGKNFLDIFNVAKGILDAKKILNREKPNIIFSKGGFVSVPVVIAAHMQKIPVIAHECDLTPGLANKLAARYCDTICVTFEETLKYVPDNKGYLTGLPIREELLMGDKNKALSICKFSNEKKPILLVVGGSLGAKCINDTVRETLNELLKTYNIIHICGKGNLDNNMDNIKGYFQMEYATYELRHFMKAADIVLSRAGANFIFEILALKKLNILVPLSKKASRGDQILNAESFRKKGYSLVIEEEKLNAKSLLSSLLELNKDKEKYSYNINNSDLKDAVSSIIELIKEKTLK